MKRSKRSVLQMECLESKVLLSTGPSDPARAVHLGAARRVDLAGRLEGLPTLGGGGVDVLTVTSFNVSGRVHSMGKVSGSFQLAVTTIPVAFKLPFPDLSDAKLTLKGRKGAVELQLGAAPFGSNVFHYKVTAGTGEFAHAFGVGKLVIRSNPAFVQNITLHSTRG